MEAKISNNTTTLISLLRSRNETLANKQTKEKVTQWKLHQDLIVLQDSKESLEPSLAELNELKNKLDQEGEFENIYKSQIQREVQNSEKMEEVLSVHDKKVQINCDSKIEKTSLLESEYENSFQDYILQRENENKVNNEKKGVLIEITNKREVEKLQFETGRNKKIYDFEKLQESSKSIEANFVEHKEEMEELQNEYDKNVAIFEDLNEGLRSVQNSFVSMNLTIEEIKLIGIQARERNSEKLTSTENEIELERKKLEQLKNTEIHAQEEFTEKCIKIQQLEHVLEKLEDENSALSVETDGVRQKRKSLEDKAHVDIAALKLKLEVLSAKRQKLDQALAAVKLCNEEKLNRGRSLLDKNSNLNNEIAKLTELSEKYDREIVTNMDKKEVYVQKRLFLKSQIDHHGASIATTQKNCTSSQETCNKMNSDLTFKVSVAQSELEKANCKCDDHKKHCTQKLDDYKYEQEKIDQQNEYEYKEILERCKTKCVTLRNLLQEENNSFSHLDNLIFEKKTLQDKYVQELKALRTASTSSSRIADIKPTSILKSPRKPTTSSKKVTFEGRGNDTDSEKSSQTLKKEKAEALHNKENFNN
ncbi:hypothetical protein RI129_004455 [Pyrocoelia pectoralis]|uniref:Uncharacterized protein n=1 Tax=Pyrocoelia pectoralis TaxID=417401 RepID=A0AAN7VJD3_9COLE